MNDKMTPISFEHLVDRCITEFRNEKTIFGIEENAFWKSSSSPVITLFDKNLENICGPAAGPHTQLTQNIIVAYLCGARFFELKTVQKLDGEDLPVEKPCIWAKTETYNVEWSTELLVEQAMDEYIKAWVFLHVLSKELELGSADGFAFNMSVGYDLEGIKLPKINNFIEGLKNCSSTQIFAECKNVLLQKLDEGVFKSVDKDFIEQIPSQVCNSVTLSTLHGCPPQEIERIASYLLTEKGLNTFIKCNPTLLGFERARSILTELGFTNLSFTAHHFEHDLQLTDAIPLLERMQALAKSCGKTFGVKITNTFPVQNIDVALPGQEMYMSGRSLYPLSLHTALLLSEAFHGNLRISFSGGADWRNSATLQEIGFYPITLATTLLKPGGYERLYQIAQSTVGPCNPSGHISVPKLRDLCKGLKGFVENIRLPKNAPRLKINQEVPLTDCFAASCKKTCPIEQDIPEYISAANEGRYVDALRIITEKNPLPFITGTICSHRCMYSCVRNDCDSAVDIRGIKLLCAEKGMDTLLAEVQQTPLIKNVSVAVVGAGPAGLAASYFLRKAGLAVTVYDNQKEAGGIVRSIIPPYRIERKAIDKDVEWVRSQGVEFKLGTGVSSSELEQFNYTVLACGAWKSGGIELETDKNPIKCFEFLSEFTRSPENVHLGEKVVVIGAGNSAMDASRTALRVPGVKKVSILYRRTREEMPADTAELIEAMHEGVEFLELLSPISHKKGILTCTVCELGEPDKSGRRSPVPTNKTVEIEADYIISATGEKIDTDSLTAFGVTFDGKKPIVNSETLETAEANVYLAGDARRGPATIVEAIADARKVADAIVAKVYCADTTGNVVQEPVKSMEMNYSKAAFERIKTQLHGVLADRTTGKTETERCLACNVRCAVCTEVCPNRANMLIEVKGKPQIIHLDALCNQCGNCEAFCPYDSSPYIAKFAYYATREELLSGPNDGFTMLDTNTVRIKLKGRDVSCSIPELAIFADSDIGELIHAVCTRYSYVL